SIDKCVVGWRRCCGQDLPADLLPQTNSSLKSTYHSVRHYSANVMVQQKSINCACGDTRRWNTTSAILSYPQTDVMIVCFSLEKPVCDNVRSKWVPEVRHYAPEAPILLVGTKRDLREDPDTIERLRAKGKAPVSTEKGLALAKEVQAAAYLECSSKLQSEVKSVFDEAIRLVPWSLAGQFGDRSASANYCNISAPF
uniref:Ras-related C3 botulinum toxin substrate 1 n=1 Tax=Macrostomum lignano TaxID=282301 RepID=A0A1I8F537_9PLAT